jgi:heme/copper-type cytochrome/quinol oxidase subunit 2
MNWYRLFYLFSIAENLRTFLVVIVTIFTIVTVISAISYFWNHEEDESDSQAMARKWVWWSTPFTILFWIFFIFMPTKKDLVIIIAGGAVGEFIAKDSNAQQLPADITRFLRGEILKATADMSNEAKEAVGIENEAEKLKKLSRDELEKMLLEYKEKKYENK